MSTKRRTPSPPKPAANETKSEVRPVGGRALKSAIDILRPYLYGAKVLDLFAGQGRFGLSALAEGALLVRFVEKDKEAARLLGKNLPKGADALVHTGDVFSYLEKAPKDAKFDLIFCDPPFPFWQEENQVNSLTQGMIKLADSDGILLVKHPSRVVLSARFPGYPIWKEKAFGESHLFFFRGEADFAVKQVDG